MNKLCINCRFAKQIDNKVECRNSKSIWRRKSMGRTAHACELWEIIKIDKQ